MELPSKLLEQIAVNTRPKIEEHLLVVMDKNFHEKHLSQPLQTNNKQFKIAVTFLTGYNGIFNVTVENYKFYFTKSVQDDNFTQISIPPGAYEIASVDKEVKRTIFPEGHSTESTYPFKLKPNFSTLGSFKAISSNIRSSQIAFTPDDSIRDHLGFKAVVFFEIFNLSPNPVDILPIDNIFMECDIARGKIYRANKVTLFIFGR